MDNSKKINDRLNGLKGELVNCSDVVYHTFVVSLGVECALVYLRGMVDQEAIQEEILQGILALQPTDSSDFYKQIFELKQISISDFIEFTDMGKALSIILEGQVLLLVDGEARMLAFPICSFEKRAIQESPNESVVRGPRDAFIEDLHVNLTLVRRRLRTAAFKTEQMIIGTKTQTKVIVAYIEGVCKTELKEEVMKRLSTVDIDCVLDSSYLEESIEDFPYSPFPQLQYSERPDVVCAALLEGRVAIMVDGTPDVLLAPVTLFMLLQAAEDYYERYIAATWIRWIRFMFLGASLILPSVYIAVTTFHPTMIPARLLLTLTSSREVVPFPALVEALLMEIAFEGLREAATRIPKSISPAVSIIGALVIGTAAVQAGIVSAAMVIIVSFTGIASFMSPNFDLGLSFRLLRFPIMLLAGCLGLFGITFGLIIIYIHLINLRSFGTPYLSPITPLVIKDLKDSFIRGPWWFMKNRPSLSADDRRQQVKFRSWTHPKGAEKD